MFLTQWSKVDKIGPEVRGFGMQCQSWAWISFVQRIVFMGDGLVQRRGRTFGGGEETKPELGSKENKESFATQSHHYPVNNTS